MSDKEKITDFTVFSNEELVLFIRKGSDAAFNELAKRFSKTVSVLSRHYYSGALTHDDWFQEGMLGFLAAVRTFDETKGAAFATYASVCISNRLRTEWKRINGPGNRPLNDSMEYDDSIVPPANSPEEDYIEAESNRVFSEKFMQVLSKTEKNVVVCYLAGFSYSATAKKLNISEKSVDNALCRAKAKLRTAFKQ